MDELVLVLDAQREEREAEVEVMDRIKDNLGQRRDYRDRKQKSATSTILYERRAR